jgi:hypothetical protein
MYCTNCERSDSEFSLRSFHRIPNLTEQTLARCFLEQVFHSLTRRFDGPVAFQRAALDGVTVDSVRSNDTSANAWRDYERIGEEVETIYAPSTPAPEASIPTSGASSPSKFEIQQPTTRTAKRDDPEYQKFTVYVPKKTHRAAKALASIQSRELSDIVAELLRDWLRNNSNTVSDAVDDV